MKPPHIHYLVAAIGFSLITMAQPTLAAENSAAPSADAIAAALQPIPAALRQGHQGLPTVGSTLHREPSQNYSTPAAYRPVTGSGNRFSHAAPRHHPAAVAAAPAAPAGCPAQADAGEKPMKDFNIAFEFGSAKLKPEAFETLRNLGRALNEKLGNQALFEIEGHTDAVGSLAFNEELSRSRAEAVKDFLVREMGVSPSRLAVVGKGFCALANPQNPYGAENRRVVVVNQSS